MDEWYYLSVIKEDVHYKSYDRRAHLYANWLVNF